MSISPRGDRVPETYRVIVIEDDLDVSQYTKTVIERRTHSLVLGISDPSELKKNVEEFEPDVIVTDIELSQSAALDLITVARGVRPGVPVIVMTAYASGGFAGSVLNAQADEFLIKPVPSADLAAHVERLARAYRKTHAAVPRRQIVLAIGARPTDVAVGVGGTLAAHHAAGDSVTILALSLARDATHGTDASDAMDATEIAEISANAGRSASVVGATLLLEDALAGTPEESQLLVDIIGQIIARVRPTIVYTHSPNDSDPDHRAVSGASVFAASSVPTIACYEGTVPSADFRPDRFMAIDGFTDIKLAMMAPFTPENNVPLALQPDNSLARAKAWSTSADGSSYCEAFEIVRESANSAN